MTIRFRPFFLTFAVLAFACAAAGADDANPAVKAGRLPGLEFDVRTKQVRVEAEALAVDMPLEFFAVVVNGPEHEAVIRAKVKPSDLHTALLAVGLKPGAPVSWSKAANKWTPPHGPPVQIHVEYEKDGNAVSEPATRWMRSVKTKKEMPATTWIFAGSRVMDDGNYAADSTGYLVSVVNFDMTVIDIPDLASASNDMLEWERNPDTVPPAGTKVTMVIEPAGKQPDDGKNEPAGKDAARVPSVVGDAVLAAPTTRGTGGAISEAELDEQLLRRAMKKWDEAVGPKAKVLREAAQAHYDAINSLRREQQRLIDEADRVQRVIDRLEREYQDMTTPQPELESGGRGQANPQAVPEAP